MVSAGHVCGTRGSGIVSSAADMLRFSVVRGMRGVGEVCEMCMCLALGGVGGEGGERIGYGPYKSRENRGNVGRVSVFGEWVGGLDQGLDGWGGVMYV